MFPRNCRQCSLLSISPFTFLLPVDGCKNYLTLSEADHGRGNIFPPHLRCKSNLATGWYRFQGAAGDQMLDKCVLNWCGSSEPPGWLDGTHPTIAEGVVERRVCFSGETNCCALSNIIKVKNCCSYYVYELQREPLFNLRYCGNAGTGKLIWDTLRY